MDDVLGWMLLASADLTLVAHRHSLSVRLASVLLLPALSDVIVIFIVI